MDAEFQFNDEQWQKFLNKIKAKVDLTGNPSSNEARTFEGIASAVVYKDINEHFEKETGPSGSWTAWSDAYETHLKRIGRGGNKKLQFSGKLRQGIIPAGGDEAKPRTWRPDGLLFYNPQKTKSGFPYAGAHNQGEGNLPQRKFMWLSAGGLQNLVNQTLKWLAE